MPEMTKEQHIRRTARLFVGHVDQWIVELESGLRARGPEAAVDIFRDRRGKLQVLRTILSEVAKGLG